LLLKEAPELISTTNKGGIKAIDIIKEGTHLQLKALLLQAEEDFNTSAAASAAYIARTDSVETTIGPDAEAHQGCEEAYMDVVTSGEDILYDIASQLALNVIDSVVSALDTQESTQLLGAQEA